MTLAGPARSADSELNRLYRERRRLASAANGSGLPAMRAWAKLEALEERLRRIDPDGDWHWEGDNWDGLGWQVRRPDKGASA